MSTKKEKSKIVNNTATREKLLGLPFEKASDLKKASDEIRHEIWERLERAKIFNELSKKEEYKFIEDEFKAGLKCRYGDSKEYLVKVFSEGIGIQVDINQELIKNFPLSSNFVETLIRSMGDTFSKSYYQAKGIVAGDKVDIEDIIKSIHKLMDK